MYESAQAIHNIDGCHLHFTEVNKENKSERKNHLFLFAAPLFPHKLWTLTVNITFPAIDIWKFLQFTCI